MRSMNGARHRPGESHAEGRSSRWIAARTDDVGSAALKLLMLLLPLGVGAAVAVPGDAVAGPPASGAIVLTKDDFRFGTYIIDRPGTYRLGEDVSFNPNSIDTLRSVVDSGVDPPVLGLEEPIDAYQTGFPLRSQLLPGGIDQFSPGGPLDARYDPAAYGVGFFAAISVTADDVVIDLAGHTIEQSAEHALLQRFFAVIELADQPFLPSQGPSDFGDGIDAARRVVIRNGTIGRSSHHGVHGNDNRQITVANVDFEGYEVAAVALNGVRGLEVRNVTATNRKDVPVLGTFSSAQFIKHYLDELARPPASTTTLNVGGDTLHVADIRSALRDSINTTHEDVMADGRISRTHDTEYGLFHNPHGTVDGNSYSFLVNSHGVAVNGFPTSPDAARASTDVSFANVHVFDQIAAIKEVPAIDVGGTAAIDPIGAVFQTRNRHPATGDLLTISDDNLYLGNPVANAQAFVAKAAANGDFEFSRLSTRRTNLTTEILEWVQGGQTFEQAAISYVCNGDSMFHVNKGAIAFRMDAARNVQLTDTSVNGLTNLGAAGSTICGAYGTESSHPAATLHGYGGSTVRAYTFAGTRHVRVTRAQANDLLAEAGPTIGFALLTDSRDIQLGSVSTHRATAGAVIDGSPTPRATAHGFHIGLDTEQVTITAACASGLSSTSGHGLIDDENGNAVLRGIKQRC